MTRSASVSPQEHARVSELLGREARGLRAIPVKDAAGQPVVIRVASLVDDKPFPTLFWLVDPGLSYRIDQLEAGGFIAELQARIDAEPDLRKAMAEDHTAHIALRNSLMSEEDRARLQSLGFFESLQQRGIGGIEKPDRIRCLHTWYAAHLVAANTIGGLVDAHWSAGDSAG
ncbi:MAG: DUF501 domain-containing protein [Halieaceae bacterium]|jgi:hypothetical protein|nr:DUF501 domain-containing protein [Halieaceae bacterium]